MKLRLGLPKGSLQEATFAMFKKAGFNLSVGSRSYFPSVDDPELDPMLIRAQEIPRYVEQGVLDAGLSGRDWVLENGAQVEEVADLVYAKQGVGRVRWVVAVWNESEIKAPEQLAGKRIATELVRVTREYLDRLGIEAQVEYSFGATEAKVPELVDAIVELTETGRSLRANNLRIVDTVLESTTKLIANRASWEDPWKRTKLQNIAVLLEAALRAEEKVGLKLNVSRQQLPEVLALLPAMKKPTISNLVDSDWVAVETIIDERQVRELIPQLLQAGAQGIVEYPLNKVIP